MYALDLLHMLMLNDHLDIHDSMIFVLMILDLFSILIAMTISTCGFVL